MESQKSNRQKNMIRETAFRLFFTDTFQSVTLKRIEQQLGISRGCVMYHYYSKQEIFSDVVDFYIINRLNILSFPDTHNSDSLKHYLHELITSMQETFTSLISEVFPEGKSDFLKSLMGFIAQAEKYYPGFHQFLQSFKDRLNDCLVQMIEKAKLTGEIKPDIDSKIQSELFQSIIVGKLFINAHAEDSYMNGLIEIIDSYYSFIAL